jgi:hypothetical protein
MVNEKNQRDVGLISAAVIMMAKSAKSAATRS